MWEHGNVMVGGLLFGYSMKRFAEGSEWGIEGGRISKLTLRLRGAVMAHYERGWDKDPATPEAVIAVDEIVRRFNWEAA